MDNEATMQIFEILKEIKGELKTVNVRLGNLETNQVAMQATVGTMQTTIGTMQTTVDGMHTTIGTMQTTVDGMQATIDEMQVTIKTIQDDIVVIKDSQDEHLDILSMVLQQTIKLTDDHESHEKKFRLMKAAL